MSLKSSHCLTSSWQRPPPPCFGLPAAPFSVAPEALRSLIGPPPVESCQHRPKTDQSLTSVQTHLCLPRFLLQKVPFKDLKNSNLSLLKTDFLHRRINVINIYKKFSLYKHEDKLTCNLSLVQPQTNLPFVSALNIGLKQTETLNLSFLCIRGEQITGVMSLPVKLDRMMSFCDVMQ